MKKILPYLLFIFISNKLNAQSSFVTTQCNGFQLNGLPFYPLVNNYILDITKNYNTNTYYLSPYSNYSDLAGYPNTGGPARHMYSAVDDEGVSLTKINNDFINLQNLGFNTIRVFIYTTYNNGNLEIPTGSYNTLFPLLDQFMNIAQSKNIKVILCLSLKNKNAWEIHETYKNYISTIANHLKNNPTIMGYDLYNEPNYAYVTANQNDKYKISNWVSEWCYAIKKYDPNHLITIGIVNPDYNYSWDAMVMPIDFVSFHFYAWSGNLQLSQSSISSYLYWASKTIKMPWIIGETGFSGTNLQTNNPRVGSESDQASFASTTLQKSLDCSCKGYSWWQYQEVVGWNDPWEHHLGLIHTFGASNGFANETYKPAASLFPTFWSMTPNTTNCIKPNNYFNLNNYPADLAGRVLDNQGNPIKNATIRGTKSYGNNYYPSFSTFTDDNGYFSISSTTPGNPYIDIIVSYPGYSIYKAGGATQNQNYYLTPVNNNKWTKKMTNNLNNTIGNWFIKPTDKFYKGDFNGDGKDELLCTNNTGGSTDLIKLYNYNSANATWDEIWSNGGNPSIGNGIYAYRANLIVGDYDGDGTEELLGNYTWTTLFKFSGGNWQWTWSDNGSPSHPIHPYKGKMYAGDFNGDSKDEILGCDLTSGGWTTTFQYNGSDFVWSYWSDNGVTSHPLRPYRSNLLIGDYDGDGIDEVFGNDLTTGGYMTLFKFSAGNWQWTWSDYGNDVVGMRPYRNNLEIGNFDNDIKDEILGFYTYATKFDFDNNTFNWSWSTGNGGIFSDWQVDPVMDSYFLFKTDKNSPEQLMAFKRFPSGRFGSAYLVNMYSYNNIEECGTYRLAFTPTNNPPKTNSSIYNISYNNEIVLFPNPAKDEVTIKFNTKNLDNTITFVDIQGKVIVELVNQNSQEVKIDTREFKQGIYFVKVKNSVSFTIYKLIIN